MQAACCIPSSRRRTYVLYAEWVIMYVLCMHFMILSPLSSDEAASNAPRTATDLIFLIYVCGR